MIEYKVFMYAFLFSMFHVLIRFITLMEIHYHKFMREIGFPIYYKFFVGTPIEKKTEMYYVKNGLRNGNEYNPPNDFDLIVRKYDKNIRLHKNEPLELNKESRTSIPEDELASWKFMSIELHINGKSMEIELSKENMYNYYIVGNVIDNSSLKFILHEHYHSKFQEIFNKEVKIERDYTLHIVDNNVNVIQIKQDSQIVIQKNGYNVL